MKKISIKEKISLIITLIFVVTTLIVNIKNFKKDVKYIASTEINNEYNTNQNKGKEINYNVKKHAYNLLETLGESIDYLKTNIDNKEKVIEVETLIDDCIVALTSIEDALNKNYKDTSSKLLVYTRDMRDDFINLKKVLEKDDQSKEKILKNIEQNYIKAKKVKDF
ncbi:hypothetical protein AAGC94_22080 [Clostridium sporogenes]|uniref:DUF8042 domain-containing protein n=1 Tax=Clostridium sporogenes TaxID=1509 RepID=A0A7U4JQM7_CLOSG|nr:hypothetical protein [Clostridium sporogenes]AVP60157.1 hypothetical protein C7M79_05360 [Clostridium botulinum]AKC63498.1 hypothetical protein CLSPO_c27780 [Clostridium sporogenes]AKJ90667.1 hypothetical protein CLSPOx_13905 [Clostridium sporogenes]KCZ67196.1 hypothetical protein CSPO_9c02110 [Clostridium sporogenes]KRU43323.1 hypothetical protein VT94_14010 [Clostridium sporogenes]